MPASKFALARIVRCSGDLLVATNNASPQRELHRARLCMELPRRDNCISTLAFLSIALQLTVALCG